MKVPYADTDFFIALAFEGDRLGKAAQHVEARYRGKIWTSLVTAVEVAVVGKRKGASVESLMRGMVGLAEVVGVDQGQLLGAARLVDTGNAGIFDAFHSVLCGEEIISSDGVYDGLGIKRIVI